MGAEVSGQRTVDGVLLELGSTLFNQRDVPAVKPKKGLTGLYVAKRSKKGAGNAPATVTANGIRGKLGSIAKRTPQVMVKISGGGKSMAQIKNHLDYISRNGKLEVEDQDGATVTGRDELQELKEEWRVGGFPIPDESNKREAFNIVLSMPEGTPALAVKRAARDFAAAEFTDHQYVMVLHTFDTDPDPVPSKHPHVHLAVKATSLDGTRLNPRKADLQRWREGFARALQEHGVEAAATNRQQRLSQRKRGEKQSVRHMRDRGEDLQQVGRSAPDKKRIAKAKGTEADVLKGYREIAKALSRSDVDADVQLADALVKRLRETQKGERGKEVQKDRGTDRQR